MANMYRHLYGNGLYLSPSSSESSYLVYLIRFFFFALCLGATYSLVLVAGISPIVRLSPKLGTSLLIFVPIFLEPSSVDLAEGTNSPILLSILAHKGIPYLPTCDIAPPICLDPAHF